MPVETLPHDIKGPAPGKEYNPALSDTKPSGAPNPALTEALQKLAGNAPGAIPASEPPKPTAEKPKPPQQWKPPDEEPEPAKAEDKPKIEEPKGKGVDQLREAYEKLKADFATKAAEGDLTKKELESYRGKAAGYETKLKSLESIEPKLADVEKRLNETSERLRIVDYTQHPEFHEKYVKPLADAIGSAHEIVKEMTIENSDGTSRQATESDFDMVLRTPNLTEATKLAKELFGPDLFNIITSHREAVLKAERSRSSAAREASARSAQWQKEQGQRAAEHQIRVRNALENAIKDQRDKYPTIYAPDEKDTEERETFERGAQMADRVIFGAADATPEEIITETARIRNRAAAVPMLLLRNQRQTARIAELEAKLAKFEKSKPNVEGRGQSNGNSTGQSKDLREESRSKLQAIADRRG